MRALFALVLLLPVATALGPSPTLVEGSGVVTVSTRDGTCEVAVVFHADLVRHVGAVAFGPGACLIVSVMPFDGKQCHEFCAGSCDDLGGGDAWCRFGEDDVGLNSIEARLRPDGIFTAGNHGLDAAGTLARAAV